MSERGIMKRNVTPKQTPIHPDPAAGPGRVRGQAGYSMIEMIVSMVIFSVGALGYASSSVVLERQITLAALESDRSAALVTAMERVRSTDFDALVSGSDSIGNYQLNWNVNQLGLFTKEVQVITVGPGMASAASGGVAVIPNVADTFAYQVMKP